MSAQNRDELRTQIDSTFIATLQIADHRAFLKDPQAESLLFRKDVIASQSPAGGLITIDYSNKDLATVTTTGNLAVSFTGMENGDVKYLRIQKNAGNTISFTGATDVSPRRSYINTTVTVVYYRVINKNNSIFVCAESVDFDFQPDLNSLRSDVFSSLLSGQVFVRINIGTWNMNISQSKTVSYTVPSGKRIVNAWAKIFRDTDSAAQENTLYRALHAYDGVLNTGVLSGHVLAHNLITGNAFTLVRTPGGEYDSSSFESRANRGVIYIMLENAV